MILFHQLCVLVRLFSVMGSNQSKPVRQLEETDNEKLPPRPVSPIFKGQKKRKLKNANEAEKENSFNDSSAEVNGHNMPKMPTDSAVCKECPKKEARPHKVTAFKSLEKHVYADKQIRNQNETTGNSRRKRNNGHFEEYKTEQSSDYESENKTLVRRENVVEKVENHCVSEGNTKMKDTRTNVTSSSDGKETLTKGVQPSDESGCNPHPHNFSYPSHTFKTRNVAESLSNTYTTPASKLEVNMVGSASPHDVNCDTKTPGTSFCTNNFEKKSLCATAAGEEIQAEPFANPSFTGVQVSDSVNFSEPKLKDALSSMSVSNDQVLAAPNLAVPSSCTYSTASSEATDLLEGNATTRNDMPGKFSGIPETTSPSLTLNSAMPLTEPPDFSRHSSGRSRHSSVFTENGQGIFSMPTDSTPSLVPSSSNRSSLAVPSLYGDRPSSRTGHHSERGTHVYFMNNPSIASALNSERNGANYRYISWDELEYALGMDNGDSFRGEALPSQLQALLLNHNESDIIEHDFSGSSLVNANTQDLSGDFITVRTSVGDTSTRISAKNITLVDSKYKDNLTDENMGIILERPKYPRYATVASRIKSFENSWPVTNAMRWEKLPEAGFVYTGTADCVRCFYCNGGLREWLKNDCPWTEHARYYPHCPHVRQCKGDDFIRTIRNGVDDVAYAQDDDSGSEMEVDVGAEDDLLSENQQAMKVAAEVITDKKLLEKAVFHLKNVQGKTSFNADELALVALDIEDGNITVDHIEGTTEEHIDVTVSEEPPKTLDAVEDLETDGEMLEEETRILKERSLCKVCLDATACVVFLDCGHMIACPMCAPALKNCAVCRAEVKGTVRAQFATDR